MKKFKDKPVVKTVKKMPIILKVNGKTERLGYYNEETKTSHLKLSSKNINYFSYSMWYLHTNYLNFLVGQNAVIEIADDNSKWKFRIDATDFMYYAKQKDNMMGCHTTNFEILKASKWTTVVECQSVSCPSNLANCCLKGTIKISKDGRCAWL